MTRPIRWLLRIALGAFICGVIAVVAIILERDNIIRHLLVSRMRAATGMDVKINSIHIGFRSHTVTIEGLKLYNTPEFGGSLCLDMPELYLELDPPNAESGSIRLRLVRLNLAQINVVTDKHGRSNFGAITRQSQRPSPLTDSVSQLTFGGKQTQMPTLTNSPNQLTFEAINTTSLSPTNSVTPSAFGGIDTLELTLGKYHSSNLRSGNEVEVDFNMTNQIFHNVKSEADLTGVAVLLAMRSPPSQGNSAFDLTELLNTLLSPQR